MGPQNAQHKREAFLTAYAACGNISEAARTARIDRTRHYDWLLADPAYKVAFDSAHEQACDGLEQEARRRAVDGVDEPIVWRGRVTDTVKKYSDTLLIFLLKGARPEKFRDRVDVQASGNLTINLVSNVDPAALAS